MIEPPPVFVGWWFFHTIFAVSRWWAVNRTGEIVVPTHGKKG